MAKIVLICSRNASRNPFSARDIQLLSERLAPDNISPRLPFILEKQGVLIGVLNPSGPFPVEKGSVCLGRFFGPVNNWSDPEAAIPDGSFALFWSNQNTVELASDVLASKTIWYVHLNNIFIAATSQRAIIFFLKDFKANRSAFPWILSSGTLGPGLSWDARIRCLKGNSFLTLDRLSWSLNIHHQPIEYRELELSEKEHELRLSEALRLTLENIHIEDYRNWLLPLSGGYDSRSILLYLKDKPNLRTITWGLKSSLDDKRNDAYIARCLADRYRINHDYFETDISTESIETLLIRFLKAGEGRIDHIPAYIDGFKIWKHIFESGCHGVIRGDESFGCKPASDPDEALNNRSIKLMIDYLNLQPFLQTVECANQSIPEELLQNDGETIAAWSDRLHNEFGIPSRLAALNDLKLSYTEVINPLLSRKIIETVRTLPDHLRTDKSLFKKIVTNLEPQIPIAKYRAIATLDDLLKTEQLVQVIRRGIDTSSARSILPGSLIDYILSVYSKNMASPPHLFNNTFTRIERKIKHLFKIHHRVLDPYILGFRIYIICQMEKLLKEDAAQLTSASKLQ